MLGDFHEEVTEDRLLQKKSGVDRRGCTCGKFIQVNRVLPLALQLDGKGETLPSPQISLQLLATLLLKKLLDCLKGIAQFFLRELQRKQHHAFIDTCIFSLGRESSHRGSWASTPSERGCGTGRTIGEFSRSC